MNLYVEKEMAILGHLFNRFRSRKPLLSRLFLLCFLLFFWAFPTFGQYERSEKWKSTYDKGAFYEGPFSMDVKNPVVEIVSLTGHMDCYQPFQGEHLTSVFYSPKQTDYYLKAEEISTISFYWMEDKNRNARQGWNYFKQWPVDGWLRRLSVPCDNLGTLVRLNLDERWRKDTFLPVFVFNDMPSGKFSLYTTQVRIGRTISGGRFTVYQGLFMDATPAEGDLLAEGNIPKRSVGQFFSVEIGKDQLPSNYAGWITVVMNMKIRNSTERIDHRYYFYHQGWNFPKN